MFFFWLAGWLVGWLVGWLSCWLVGWLTHTDIIVASTKTGYGTTTTYVAQGIPNVGYFLWTIPTYVF